MAKQAAVEQTLKEDGGAEIQRSAKRKTSRRANMNEDEEAMIAELEQSLKNLRAEVGGMTEDLTQANNLMHALLTKRINFINTSTDEFNAREFESCLSLVKRLCCEKAKLIHPSIERQVQGPEAMAEDLQLLLESFPKVHLKIMSVEPVQDCGQQLKIRYEVVTGPMMKPYSGVGAFQRSVTAHIQLNVTFKGMSLEASSIVWCWNAAEFIFSLLGLEPHSTSSDRI